MARKPPLRALTSIDPQALATFQAGIRKRYSNELILKELSACAERLGRSPTMREFAADGEVSIHPQTVIEHFGSWNAAKRKAVPAPTTPAPPPDGGGDGSRPPGSRPVSRGTRYTTW